MRIYFLYFSVVFFGSPLEIQYHTIMLDHLFKQTNSFRNASFLNSCLIVFLLVRCLFIIVVFNYLGRVKVPCANIDLNQLGVQRF